MENGTSVDYQVPVEELEEEVPSDGTLAGASGTGAGSGAGAGAGAGFRLTTRFLAAFRAFFFIAFLAFFFFFAKTRFTEIMFRLWKPNKACLGTSPICRRFCRIRVSRRRRVDRAAEWSNWSSKWRFGAPVFRDLVTAWTERIRVRIDP
jgi:hypothetical protein